MWRSPGTRLGLYEITEQIGVGGTGEVYREIDRMEGHALMSFCEHCEGQRFDRARILRVLRESRRRLRRSDATCSADQVLASVVEAVRTLDIPHLERVDDLVDGEVVH